MMGSGSGLGRQRPPDRCKRRMNSHIVTVLSPSRSFCTNPSPHTHASSGWGEAPLSIQVRLPRLPSGVVLDDQEDVACYYRVFLQLQASALSPAESVPLLRAMAA
jgi:hypothetical protein